MTEVVAFILGRTGPLEQVITILKDVKDRISGFGTHHVAIDHLIDAYKRISYDIAALDMANLAKFPDHVQFQVRSTVDSIRLTLEGTLSTLQPVKEKMKSRLFRISAFKRTDDLFKQLDAKVDTCRTHTLLLANLFCNTAAPAPLSTSAQIQAPPRTEIYTPSFSTEENNRNLPFDFDTKTAENTFSSFEGRLKAMVLGNSTAVGAVSEPINTAAPRRGASCSAVVALGIGGVGKTSALREIAQQPEVIERFPGGVFFHSLGKDAVVKDIVAMLATFVQTSGGTTVASEIINEDIGSAMEKACAWFSGKVCLFIVDDIWKSAQIPSDIVTRLSPLAKSSNCASGGSRIVYSTRDEKVARDSGGTFVEFKRREENGPVSRSMLLTAAEEDEEIMQNAESRTYVVEILNACGGLPMTLDIAGRTVHEMKEWYAPGLKHTAWKEYARKLENINAILDNDDYEERGFYASLRLSIDFLDNNFEAGGLKYADAVDAFCVLRKQDWVPFSVLQHMWGLKSLSNTHSTVQKLSSFGIIDIVSQSVSGVEVTGLRFHDHIHAYAVWSSSKNAGIKYWYSKAVNAYAAVSAPVDRRVPWPTVLEDDGYMQQNICRLLIGAWDIQTAARTLSSGHWVTKMMATGQSLQYEQDIEYLSEARSTHNMFLANLYTRFCGYVPIHKKALTALSKIIRLSQPGCMGHIHAAWFQLYGRLQAAGRREEWMESIMREAEDLAPRPFLRSLLPCLHYPSEALTEVYSLPGPITFARHLGNDAVVACSHNRRNIYFSVFEKGSLPKITEINIDNTDDISRVWCVTVSQDTSTVISGHSDGSIRKWDSSTGAPIGAPLVGHTDSVYSVSMSGDGARIVSGSGDNTVRVWDAHTGAPIGPPLVGHTALVKGVSMSGDGTRIVSGSADNTVRLWDAHTGSPIGVPLVGHTDSVRSVSLSDDGARIVSGSADKTVCVRDAHTDAPIAAPLKGHTDLVDSVSEPSERKTIVSGSDDNTVRVWDAHTDAPIGAPFVGHTGRVLSVSTGGDGTRIVSGSDDNTVRVWDAHTGVPIGDPLVGHTDWVDSVSMSRDGARIVSGSWDKTVRLWDARTGAPIGAPLVGHTRRVRSVSVSVDGARIVSGSDDNTVRVWDAHTGALIGVPLVGHTNWVRSVSMSGDGTRIVSGSDDNTVRVWDALTGRTIGAPLVGHPGKVLSVNISCDGARILSGFDDNTVRVWDALTGAPIGTPLVGHTGRVLSVGMSVDGACIVSGSDGDTVRVWDAHTGAPIGAPLVGHTDWVRSVNMSGDIARILSGSDDNIVRMRDTHTGAPIGVRLVGQPSTVPSISMSSDGARIVSASLDKTVRVWDAHTGAPIGAPLTGHTDRVRSVSISGDGACIVSGSNDNTVRVWDANTGAPIGAPLVGHTASVTSVSMSGDGARIVSGSDDRTVRVWDAHTGAPIGAPLAGHTYSVTSVSMSGDGARIVSQDCRGIIKLWLLGSSEPKQTMDINEPEAAARARQEARDFLLGSNDDETSGLCVMAATGNAVSAKVGRDPAQRVAVFDSEIVEFCVSRDGRIAGVVLDGREFYIVHAVFE